ncbi:hypothetical protein J1N35_033824 [Gossypium stocksii]|uniref:Uncharacterized protein n=1 Tax=Gossypium stocksii TaxID=47602 RepID=A0A9D3USU4_9ROSI|nr:hypothetical protein J1N35_033824 [Gossypium stocksii]
MCGNSELGTEALAELVSKVTEEVLETKVKEIRETLQLFDMCGNSELGTEALAELVRKVVEEVLEAKFKGIREALQAGCLEWKKRKDHSSQGTESRSVKHVRARPNFPTC